MLRLSRLSLLFVPLVAYAGNSGLLSFNAPRSFPASAASIALGDFNGDGKPDLAGISYSNYSVSVLLGNGDGAFQPEAIYPLTDGPVRFIATADLNRDGKLDLVVAGGNYVYVLLGNGDGAFQPGVRYPAGAEAASLAVGDLNGDGIPDLAVDCRGAIVILFGNGDGTFAKPVPTNIGGGSPILADFNGDGKLDLAVTVNPGFEILLGNGDGAFQPPVHYGSANLYTLIAADFNGDGKLDLAGGEIGRSTNQIDIFLGNGAGGFQQSGSYPTSPEPRWLSTGDLNGDGHLDLVSNNGTILLGNGDGTFHQVAGFFDPGGSTSVVVADFNADGKQDLAVGNDSGFGGVFVLLGNGEPKAKFQSPTDFALPGAAGAVAVGDFNNDGNQDIAVVSTSAIYILLGNGNGTFLPPLSANVVASPAFIAVGDFNHDGNLDLAVTSLGEAGSPGSVSVLLGNGNGTFQPPVSYAAGMNPYAVVAADFKHAGKLDLSVVNTTGSVSILIGNGDGTFQPAVDYSIPIGPNASAVNLATADLNADGHADLVVNENTYDYSPPATVVVLLGNGDGTFQAPVSYTIPSPCDSSATAIGDLNGDGILDLVVAADGCVAVLLGNGDGTFQPPVIAANVPVVNLALHDFNRDGELDLVMTDYYTNAVFFMLGNGDGTFQPPEYFAAGAGRVSGLALADFDRNGHPSVAAGVGSAVAILTENTP